SMTVAGDRSDDDIRLDLLQLVVAQPESFHHAGREVFDDHVTFFDQLLYQSDTFGLIEVYEQALLAETPLVKKAGAINTTFHPGRIQRQTTSDIHSSLRLDLDDFGSE